MARHKSKLQQLDTVDAVALTVYQVFIGVMLGVFAFGVQIVDFDFSEALYQFSSVVISADAAIAALAAGIIVFTNEFGGSDYTLAEKGVLGGTLGMPVVYMAFEPFRDLIAVDPWVAVIFWALAAIGSVVLAAVEDVGFSR